MYHDILRIIVLMKMSHTERAMLYSKDKYILYLLLDMNVTEHVMCRRSEAGLWRQTGASDTSYPRKYLSRWGFHLLRSNKTGLSEEMGFGSDTE